MSTLFKLLGFLLAVNIHYSMPCPNGDSIDLKAAYKVGDMPSEHSMPITLDKIKAKLKEAGIFDQDTVKLNDRERKELKKLFDTVEIMSTSRARQPQSVQNMFSCLRMIERVMKKQLKEGQISESLAAKFNWEKLTGRIKRAPQYHIDQTTNMRVFTTN